MAYELCHALMQQDDAPWTSDYFYQVSESVDLMRDLAYERRRAWPFRSRASCERGTANATEQCAYQVVS